jgi:hypothetical protein
MANGFVNSTPLLAQAMPWVNASTMSRVAGHTRVAQYGHTPAAAANTDTWEGGGLYAFQAAAVTLEALSASANDTAAGTGARTFTIMGLDNNFNPISETITLNGVTPVQSVLQYRRVNNFTIASAGSGNVNAGDVTLRVTGAGATQAIARALYGYSKSAIYTVPAGFSLLVTDLLLECGGTGAATNITFSFTRISSSGLITTTNEYPTGPTVPVERVVFTGAMVPSTTTLTVRITAVTGATSGYAAFNGILIDNTQII